MRTRGPSLGECKSCGAEIYWVSTTNGRSTPMNAKVEPEGGWVLTLKPDGTPLAEIFHSREHINRNRYISHFATCPSAGDHRRHSIPNARLTGAGVNRP